MTHLTPLDLASQYLARGLCVLPVEYKGKRPFHNGGLLTSWQHLRLNADDLPAYFNGHDQNIGILLGAPSGGLIDIDLDCAESISIAPFVLPQTHSIFGRSSNPNSHWLYVSKLKTEKFADPLQAQSKDKTERRKAMICEIRSTGAQTVFPGSTHESGELITWSENGEALATEAGQLRSCVAWLAAACLLVRYWPDGSRHDASLALAGGLLRAGWTEDETAHLIEAVCRAANDEETQARIRNIVSTSARLESGAETTGWPRLAQIIDARIVDKVREWLKLQTGSQRAMREESGDVKDTDSNVNAHGYFLKNGCLTRSKQTRDGSVDVPLCNFNARIVSDIVEDDGSMERRIYELRGRLSGKDSDATATISADEFPSLRWIDGLLGASATVYAGQNEHVRCAVKLLSNEIEEKHVYTHTGWREIDGQWYYLHGGGAIGSEGNRADITVRLPDTLGRFVLPDPPCGDDLVRAIRHHLNAADLADTHVTFPLFGGCWAALLGDCDFSMHVAGDTGAGKSEIAALAQAHFGSSFDREHLPASWSSTGNSLERLAHAAKDAVLIVDDFAPAGTATDTARLHREADRLLRAQGNQAGRLRLKSDSSFNAARAPRGLIVSTGEDIPSGSSLRARLWTLEVEKASARHKGSIDFNLLTEKQQQAREGVYSSVTAAFAKWLAPRYDSLRSTALEEVARLRNEFAAHLTGHKRHATTTAKLMRAWTVFLTFAHDVGALSDYEKDSLIKQIRTVLPQVAALQETHQASQDPATRFIELIIAALNTGQAHISSMTDGEPPFQSNTFGWRNGERQGKHIGWTNQTHIFLQPDAAFSLVSEVSNRSGSALTLTQTTLWKRLSERGLLIREEGRETFKSRITINKQRLSVVAFKTESFHSAELCDQNLTSLTVEEMTDK